MFKTTNDERNLTYEDVLLPIYAGYLEHVDVDLFFRIINETDFDKVSALMAF